MLIVSFSVAVDEDLADEMRNTLMDDYGITIVKEAIYNEKLCWAEVKPRIYFECFAPIQRIRSLTEYLDNEFTGTAILSY